MSAMLGADDLAEFQWPRPDLLRQVTGLEPEPGGLHVLLDEHTGVQTTQRLTISDIGGSIQVAMWPGELKSQALVLYTRGRAEPMILEGLARGWTVRPSPHLAFFHSRPEQRLYMLPDLDPVEYALRWEGPDREMIGRHPNELLRGAIIPWLIRRGYLTSAGSGIAEAFAKILGRRPVDVRPGLRFKRRWDSPGSVVEIRADVEAVLGAGGDEIAFH